MCLAVGGKGFGKASSNVLVSWGFVSSLLLTRSLGIHCGLETMLPSLGILELGVFLPLNTSSLQVFKFSGTLLLQWSSVSSNGDDQQLFAELSPSPLWQL